MQLRTILVAAISAAALALDASAIAAEKNDDGKAKGTEATPQKTGKPAKGAQPTHDLVMKRAGHSPPRPPPPPPTSGSGSGSGSSPDGGVPSPK